MILFFACALALAAATILPVDPHNPCLAYLNGSQIDLSTKLSFPQVLRKVPGNSPSGFYDYEWDCAGRATSCGPNVAVCQTTGGGAVTFEAGGSPLKALWFTSGFGGSGNMITIFYPSDLLRMAAVQVMIDNGRAPSFRAQAQAEHPSEQYNFIATINCNKHNGTVLRNC